MKKMILATLAFSLVAGWGYASQHVTYQETITDERGKTIIIAEQIIIDLCADRGGCSVHISMSNPQANRPTTDDTFLFYYNPTSKAWHTSNNASGINGNGTAQHTKNTHSCYFTDGSYNNWSNQGDNDLDFGLLSQNKYRTKNECRLTIFD